MSSSKREAEDAAMRAFVDCRRMKQGEHWIVDNQPDDIDDNSATPDYILRDSATNRLAALEVTQFDWPMNRSTTHWRLRALAESIQAALGSSLHGRFTLTSHINAVLDSGLFGNRHGPSKRLGLLNWIRQTAPKIGLGRTARIPVAPGLAITRQSNDGAFELSIPTSDTNILYPDWTKDLNKVLVDNARKFEDYRDLPRWLLVIYPGVRAKFEISGRALEVPEEIDDLFFVNNWPPTAEVIFSYNDIADLSEGLHYDPDTGRFWVDLPARVAR